VFGFTGQAAIEVGKQLGFRIALKNNGPIGIDKHELVLAGAVVPDNISQEATRQMADRVRTDRNTITQMHDRVIIPVAIGNSIYKDLSTEKLAQWQVEGLLTGTVHVYLYILAWWEGSDGLAGETEMCVYLQKPHSKYLQPADFKDWGVAPIPAPTHHAQ